MSSWAIVVAAAVLLWGCRSTPQEKPTPVEVVEPVDAGPPAKVEVEAASAIELPPAPPVPPAPVGLPTIPGLEISAEKSHLGWLLFYEPRLSANGTMACAACHHLDKALTSGKALDAKVGGGMNTRNAPTMYNLAPHPSYYWDGRAPTLEAVSLAAWKGQLGADPAVVTPKLAEVPVYAGLFSRAFGSPGVTAERVTEAFAHFFKGLQAGNAPFDHFVAGDNDALSKKAKAGWKLFQERGCANCHPPPYFSDFAFHHVGVGNDDPGRFNATKDEADRGRFKTPSLRNVAMTAPYFHDGSAATLVDAVTQMAQGGARKSPPLDPLLKPKKISAADAANLAAFLESLSGELPLTNEPTLP